MACSGKMPMVTLSVAMAWATSMARPVFSRKAPTVVSMLPRPIRTSRMGETSEIAGRGRFRQASDGHDIARFMAGHYAANRRAGRPF